MSSVAVPVRRTLAPGDAARLEALVAAARHQCEADDFETAERSLRAVLDEARGTGSQAEWRAVADLFHLNVRLGRDLELLPLARRLVELADARGDAASLCGARQAVTIAFGNLEDWDRLIASLPAFEEAIARLPAGEATRHEINAASMHCSAAFELGRPDEARALLARADAVAATMKPDAWWTLSRTIMEARLHLVRGDAQASLRCARRAISRSPTFVGGIDAHVVEIEAAFACEGAAAAGVCARRLTDLVDAAGDDLPAPSLIVHAFSGLGRFLHERCGLAAEARRAYDLAAAAALRRVAEIERSHDDLPELAVRDPDDAAALAQFRARFQERRHALMESVATLLREEAAAGRAVTFAGTTAAGWVSVCAWCLRARPAGGAWTPIGHFVPNHDDAVRVTHGICEGCLAGAMAG